MSEYGPTWAELRQELMTPEEMAESDANVKALTELLEALELYFKVFFLGEDVE